QASFLAFSDQEPQPIGAILITLLPAGDPCDLNSYYWPGPPPPNSINLRLGRPHLTWIFVAPLHTQHGVATTLLAAAAEELRQLGFTELLSTFLLGNDSSMLWHWRAGFQLLSHPGSKRRKSCHTGAESTKETTSRKTGQKKPAGKKRNRKV